MEIYITIGLLIAIAIIFVTHKVEEKKLKDDMDIYSYRKNNTASNNAQKSKRTRIDTEEDYIIESNQETVRTRDGEHVVVDFSVNVRGNGNQIAYNGDDIMENAKCIINGNVREIVASFSSDDISKNMPVFSRRIFDESKSELGDAGVEIVSMNIRDIIRK